MKIHNNRLHADAQTYAVFVGFATLHFTTKTSPVWALVSRALHAKRRGLAPSQLIDISINSDTIICMAKIQDILSQMRESPKSIKFNDLCKVCDAYFGEPRQSASSHRVYRTPWKGDPRVNIQNAKGMSKAYQVKQVLQAVERLEVQNGKKY